MNDMTTIINVYLLDEGTPTWRPTQAINLQEGLYKILPTADYDPSDEKWEFPPGSIVRAEPMILYDGKENHHALVAVSP